MRTVMKDTPKLFRVNTKSLGKYSSFYVVAPDPTAAYEMVRYYLNKRNLCFASERELKSVELLGEAYNYTDTECLLLLPDSKLAEDKP